MTEIKMTSIDRAWISLLSTVFFRGKAQSVQVQGVTTATVEHPNLTVVIPGEQSTQAIDSLMEMAGTSAMLEKYIHQLCAGGDSKGFDYTYYDREVKFQPVTSSFAINQRQCAETKLIADPTSRQALTVTWDPTQDNQFARAYPCKILDQWYIRNGRLNLDQFFRSWDVASAAPLNMVGHIYRMRQEKKNYPGIELGNYIIRAGLPHIYWYDLPKVAALLADEMFDDAVFRQLSIWKNAMPDMKWDTVQERAKQNSAIP